MPIHTIPQEEQPSDGIGNLTKSPVVELPVDPETSKSFKVGDEVEITVTGVIRGKKIEGGENRSLAVEVRRVNVYVNEDDFAKMLEESE